MIRCMWDVLFILIFRGRQNYLVLKCEVGVIFQFYSIYFNMLVKNQNFELNYNVRNILIGVYSEVL